MYQNRLPLTKVCYLPLQYVLQSFDKINNKAGSFGIKIEFLQVVELQRSTIPI